METVGMNPYAEDYLHLWNTSRTREDKVAIITTVCDRMHEHELRYLIVAQKLHRTPWEVVAVIHHLEGGGNFSTHLHNGDPLTARTVHVPAGRPEHGEPPFTWEYSAVSALTDKGAQKIERWDVPTTLYFLEKYNGMGYRHHDIPSPYLWSFTWTKDGKPIYVKGKYVTDGKWNPDCVSKQIGAVALLRGLNWVPQP
jgi:lysozyme family protein